MPSALAIWAPYPRSTARIGEESLVVDGYFPTCIGHGGHQRAFLVEPANRRGPGHPAGSSRRWASGSGRRGCHGPAAARASRASSNASLPRWFSRDWRSSGQAQAAGEAAGQRLGVVVEVDQQRLAEAALDEAVGVAVERCVQRLAGQVPGDVPGQRCRPRSGPPTRPWRSGCRRRRRSRTRSARPWTAGCADRWARSRVRPPGRASARRKRWPPCSGTTTARSNGTSRPS